ncbi:tudor domain containing 3 [Nomia melanderi]|uniref:tudor domain containing 3 n=1 Tax=Nomia melanderi TaxID=2448451 RepID=UPI0013040D71|nr:tudor domain-containing protein 3 [Nomia melanderi]XP_031844947.1 tudor domain-containing protein 3 [Nomia melanderi]XP_031844948.1 tudor domain-containing protein 3 [Nomia melanderi]XP_031844949.1 tudor domain-containing protein 3 [Nomia melanderi]XP_031844950.1 tudor domain-containing protein 3 [Nomia melanderi]XP_031844951.1 tudor domain-containing protein 3 [Nomia melanderi]
MTVNIMKLKDKGWYITDHGYYIASDAGNIVDIQKIIKRLLDLDLREIGNGQGDAIQGNIVLQIQKIRNVAAPKNNEESRAAPRLLKLSLTDGKNNYQAIELEHISSLSLNTPPGTKILIGSVELPTSHGIILLRPSHIVQVLGGKVTNLVEKWELNKKLALHTRVRSTEEGGPPPWIPFGKKIIKVSENDKNFKALAEKEKSSKENAEFEAQRKDAIAEAAKQGSKKIFGGGNKQLLDHSVQKIVDQGFSIEQAEYALKFNRNNVDKALKSLQKTDNKHNTLKETREPRNKRFDKKSEENKPSSGKISLFDFLEDKLPIQSETTETNITSQNSHTQNTENSYDRVEVKTNDAQSRRGGRSQRGGRGYQVPPRHSEENKNNKKLNFSNTSTPQYSQYNGGNNSQQNKPPRFQKNQDNHNYNQQDTRSKTYQKSQLNDARNSGFQMHVDGTNVNDNSNYYKGSQEQQGKNFGSSRSYNHHETDARNRQTYDASYGRHNRPQEDVTHRVYPTNPNDKNYKNQLNKFQPNDSSGGKSTIGPNSQRVQSHYSNNQSANVSVGSSWVWRVGDKCLAKYWEDNRYYNAKVTGVSDRTCVVQFKGFENYEEVLQVDCLPITDDYQVQDYGMDQKQLDQWYNNKQVRYEQTQNHIAAGMEFRRSGSGVVPPNKSNYNKKRNQQRSTQPIYQPPAQRCQSSMPMNTQSNPLL